MEVDRPLDGLDLLDMPTSDLSHPWPHLCHLSASSCAHAGEHSSPARKDTAVYADLMPTL